MFKVTRAIANIVALGCSGVAMADTVSVTHGGDTFVAGAQVNEAVNSAGDAFLAARTIQARGSTAGDLHVSGIDVSISAATAGDLYAVGATVVIRSTVAQDLTVEGPIEGALVVDGAGRDRECGDQGGRSNSSADTILRPGCADQRNVDIPTRSGHIETLRRTARKISENWWLRHQVQFL